MFGHVCGVWIHLDIFQCIWIYLDSFGCIWIQLGPFGYIWIHLDPIGIHLDIFAMSGYIWIHLDLCGYMWVHVYICVICGCTAWNTHLETDIYIYIVNGYICVEMETTACMVRLDVNTFLHLRPDLCLLGIAFVFGSPFYKWRPRP